MTKLDHALQLAQQGRPVFPLNRKTPFRGCDACSETIYHPNANKMVPNPDRTCTSGATCECISHGNPDGKLCHAAYAGSTDLDVIRAWWSKTPNANIGHHLADWRYVVVDVDPQNNGDLAFTELEERFGTLDAAQVVRTPNGGLHYYLDNPERIPVRRGQHAVGSALLGRKGEESNVGIDIKSGPGSYVLAPGSEVDGNAYTRI